MSLPEKASGAPAAEKRQRASLRRDLNDLVRNPEGKVSEAKVMSLVGKGLAAWLLWKHAGTIVTHYDTLLVLLGVLIFPDMVKKFISMKYDPEKKAA